LKSKGVIMSVDYNDENYNYKAYWNARSYEHNCEVIALKKLLPKKGNNIVDIGGGFGRLSSVYGEHFNNATIMEPSKKLLQQAKLGLNPFGLIPNGFNPNYVNSSIYDAPKKLEGKYDCAIMIRVLHHLDDLNSAILSVSKLMVKDGVFILEFANKMHFLNILKNVARLNFRFFSSQPYKLGTFTLWHPPYVQKVLEKNDFAIKNRLSVSNLRSPLIKKLIPEKILLTMENLLQKPLSYINFGPSIFIKTIKV